MDSIRDVFAYRLRELRGNRTQAEFAEYLDLSLRTYQDLESGNVPQRKSLEKIVEKLGLASETPLFCDPDLIPVAPKPSVEDALGVITQFVNKSRKSSVSESNDPDAQDLIHEISACLRSTSNRDEVLTTLRGALIAVQGGTQDGRETRTERSRSRKRSS